MDPRQVLCKNVCLNRSGANTVNFEEWFVLGGAKDSSGLIQFPPCSLSEVCWFQPPNFGRMPKSGKPKHNHSSNNGGLAFYFILVFCFFICWLLDQIIIISCRQFPFFSLFFSKICQFYFISPPGRDWDFPYKMDMFV